MVLLVLLVLEPLVVLGGQLALLGLVELVLVFLGGLAILLVPVLLGALEPLRALLGPVRWGLEGLAALAVPEAPEGLVGQEVLVAPLFLLLA